MQFIYKVCLRMASPQTLNLLKTQAEQADKILAELRTQISVLKEAAVSYAGKGEVEQLQKQNEILKKEVEQAKMQLVMAEIHNGVRQVFVPNRSMTTSAPDITVKTETVEKKKEEKPKIETAEKKKEDKPKKEKKQAPKGKAAEKPDNKAEQTVDISRLDLRIGKIMAVQKHPDADTLYIEEVDVGEEKRRIIVSGLVKAIPLDQMQDRLAVFMCNLKPVKMRGVFSEGMIMCASNPPDRIEILIPPTGVVPGDRVTFEGYPGEPDAVLPPKKKIWETLKPFITTDANKVATYKGVPFKVEGKGIVVAETLANAQIS